MLAQALTTATCQNIIQLLLKKRRWTLSRIGRVIEASPDYVRRIQFGKQSFQVSDVEALAKACRQQPALLLFDSMRPEKMPPGLHDLAKQEVERHQEFRRALRRKPAKKRRARTKAA